MIKGLFVPTDGAAQVREYEDEGNLQRLQGEVEGLIEGISGPDWYAYGNDEAKLVGMDTNEHATRLACYHGWYACGQDVLAGPIVFFGPGDDEGNDTSVPESLLVSAERLGIL